MDNLLDYYSDNEPETPAILNEGKKAGIQTVLEDKEPRPAPQVTTTGLNRALFREITLPTHSARATQGPPAADPTDTAAATVALNAPATPGAPAMQGTEGTLETTPDLEPTAAQSLQTVHDIVRGIELLATMNPQLLMNSTKTNPRIEYVQETLTPLSWAIVKSWEVNAEAPQLFLLAIHSLNLELVALCLSAGLSHQVSGIINPVSWDSLGTDPVTCVSGLDLCSKLKAQAKPSLKNRIERIEKLLIEDEDGSERKRILEAAGLTDEVGPLYELNVEETALYFYEPVNWQEGRERAQTLKWQRQRAQEANRIKQIEERKSQRLEKGLQLSRDHQALTSGGNPFAHGGEKGGGTFALNYSRSRDSSSSASNSEREGGKVEIIDSAVVGKVQGNIVKLSGFANNPAEHDVFDMKEGLPHITSSIVSSSLGVVPRVPATRPVTTTTRIMNEKDVVGVADRYKVIQGHQLHYDGSGKQHLGDDLPHLRQGLAHIVEDDVKTTQKKRYNRSEYDVSHLIPVKTLLPHEWETTSLQSFSVNECAALKKTGCAKVSINGVPSLTKLQSSVPDQISLLFQLTHGKLTAYMYRFTEPPVITTPSSSSLAAGSGSLSSSSTVASPVKAWGVKYSSIRKHIQPGNFLKLAQKEEESGHFKGLPQTLPFNDDLYWSRVSSGALALSQERPVITYPADNPASILATIHDFPKAWNIGTLDKESDLLRAIMPDLDFYEDMIEGYTTSALYIGASGATFALHAEDMNLASVNYLIAGAPKVWYCVPPSEYTKIVDLISKIFAGSSLVKSCPQAVI